MKKHIRPDRSSFAVAAFVNRSLRSARMRAGLRTSAVTVGLALSVGSNAAWSEEPARADDVQLLEEIVVTAQFREQGLQSTPVAITAVTAVQLEQKSLTSVTDLNGLAPNLTAITKREPNIRVRMIEADGDVFFINAPRSQRLPSHHLKPLRG